MANPIWDAILTNSLPVAAVSITLYTLITGRSERGAERAQKLAEAAEKVKSMAETLRDVSEETTRHGVLVTQHDIQIAAWRELLAKRESRIALLENESARSTRKIDELEQKLIHLHTTVSLELRRRASESQMQAVIVSDKKK